MDNSNSGLTAADVLALTKNGSAGCDMLGGSYFWWVIIFFIIAGMFNGNGGFFGNNNNTATTDFVANQFSNQNDKFLSLHNTDAIAQTNRDVLESSFATTKEVLENRYNNALQTNQLQAQMSNDNLRTQMQLSNNALENQMQMSKYALEGQMQSSNNALQSQMQLAQCCCTLREEGQANTQKILDAICQNQISELRDKLADRDRELQTARFQISQIDQTANLTNTLRPFPQPAYITASPYQSYYPYGYYGNGVSGVV